MKTTFYVRFTDKSAGYVVAPNLPDAYRMARHWYGKPIASIREVEDVGAPAMALAA